MAELDAAAADHQEQIAVVCNDIRAGAITKVHYTALRMHNVRGLQSDPTDLRVTSLRGVGGRIRAGVLGLATSVEHSVSISVTPDRR